MKSESYMGQILIIDDQPSIRRILFMILTELGYDVKVAESGEEGIALFDLISDFDLVITDIDMPGINGNAVGRYIRDSPKSDTPLVAITAFPDKIQQGVFNFSLVKPFDLEELQKIAEAFAH